MKRYIAYLKYLFRHKWFVFFACRKLGIGLWIAIMHDISKFLPSEFIPYARTFYKSDGSKQYIESDEFAKAWNHHQKRNKHHWQYWLLTWDRGEEVILYMPTNYAQEMIADWIGAGKAITGKDNPLQWYGENKHKIKLHSYTRDYIEIILGQKIKE